MENIKHLEKLIRLTQQELDEYHTSEKQNLDHYKLLNNNIKYYKEELERLQNGNN